MIKLRKCKQNIRLILFITNEINNKLNMLDYKNSLPKLTLSSLCKFNVTDNCITFCSKLAFLLFLPTST